MLQRRVPYASLDLRRPREAVADGLGLMWSGLSVSGPVCIVWHLRVCAKHRRGAGVSKRHLQFNQNRKRPVPASADSSVQGHRLRGQHGNATDTFRGRVGRGLQSCLFRAWGSGLSVAKHTSSLKSVVLSTFRYAASHGCHLLLPQNISYRTPSLKLG